jgi:hypothetical protein
MDDGSSAGTVVLVHGGFVDGSGWQGVYHQLTKDGYSVSLSLLVERLAHASPPSRVGRPRARHHGA